MLTLTLLLYALYVTHGGLLLLCVLLYQLVFTLAGDVMAHYIIHMTTEEGHHINHELQSSKHVNVCAGLLSSMGKEYWVEFEPEPVVWNSGKKKEDNGFIIPLHEEPL
jgi:hypothetical protein